jgi:DNA-binding GntR family transcriptional regulator
MTKNNNAFKTSAELAYEIIREKIIEGEFEPGVKLTRRHMSSITGVSIIPVIEALQKLENEGLVRSEPHFGTCVIDLDAGTIRDRLAMRMAIECEVARILSIRKKEDYINQLYFMAKELDETPRSTDPKGIFWERHHAFHIKMAEYTGHQSFVKELNSLNLFDILRRSVQHLPQGPTTPVPSKHHEKIIDAVAAGDPDNAEKVMRSHIHYSGLVTEESL